MWLFTTRCWLPVLAVMVCLTPLILPAAADDKAAKKEDDGFTDLFNGKDFTGWKLILKDPTKDPKDTWSIKDGLILCTGHPHGYFYTEKVYKNYIVRYDWR